MAQPRKFLTSLDLTGLELLNVRLQNLATAPTATEGRIYYDTVLKKVRFYDGTSWIDAGGGTATLDTEAVQDIVGAMVAGNTETNVTVTYDDTAGVLNFVVADASTTAKGVVQLATSAETTTGTDALKAVTPATLKTELDKKAQLAHTHGASDLPALNAITAPTGDVAMNAKKITGLADPVSAQDAATKAYVDNLAAGLDPKGSVRVASTANIASLSGLLTIDGVTLVAGDRVLVKNQTTKAQNGIWVAAAGAWTRPTDADSAGDLSGGTFVFVEAGTQQDTGWVITTDGPITPGTTAHDWGQYSGAGSWVAGAGLTQTGNTIQAGAGTGIVVNADDIAIDTSVVSRRVTAIIGDGATTVFTITHNLNNRYPDVEVILNSGTYETVDADVQRPTVNTVTVGFAVAPTANAYAVTVTG